MKDCGTQVVEHNVRGRLALHSQNDKIHIRSDQTERQMVQYNTTIRVDHLPVPLYRTMELLILSE